MKSKRLMALLGLMVTLIGWNMQSAEAGEDVAIKDWVTDAQGRKIEVGSINDGLLNCILVRRLLSDGSLDFNFGTDGQYVYRFGCGSKTMATAVELLPSGKIVVAGQEESGVLSPIVLRLNDDGTLDENFGERGGDTHIYTALAVGSVDILEVLGDNIFVGGMFPGNTSFFIARLSIDGKYGPYFAGLALFTLGAPTSLEGIIVQPDGRVRAEVKVAKDGQLKKAIIEFNADGTVNRDFGDDGIMYVGEGDIVEAIDKSSQEVGETVPTDIARLIEEQ